MRQFDVFENANTRSRAIAPYVVIVQSHLLDDLPTVVVAPLLRPHERPAYTYVSVELDVLGQSYVLSLAELAVMDRRALGRHVADVKAREDDIRRAIGRIFTGF